MIIIVALNLWKLFTAFKVNIIECRDQLLHSHISPYNHVLFIYFLICLFISAERDLMPRIRDSRGIDTSAISGSSQAKVRDFPWKIEIEKRKNMALRINQLNARLINSSFFQQLARSNSNRLEHEHLLRLNAACFDAVRDTTKFSQMDCKHFSSPINVSRV